MSSEGTRGFDDRWRDGVAQAGVYAGRASRWGERNLPGGSRTLWAGLGLIVVIGLLVLLRPAATTTSPAGGLGGPMPVGIAKVTSGDIAVTLDALGTVTPLATVTVRPQVSGEVVKIDFAEGKMVKAGDVLAEIDPRTYDAQLGQAKGVLAKDEALLENAQLDLKRYNGLAAQNAISAQQRDTQAALVRQYEGTLKSDEASVQSAAVNLGYTNIVSPVDGRAGIRQVDIGNIVQAGQATGIVVVTQLQPISILFSLPEDDLDQIMQQVNRGATLEVDAYDRTQSQKLATGKLSAVDSQIDTTTGSVKLRAMFDNQDAALFPNQFVNVRLVVTTLRNQTTVPGAAIQKGTDGNFVYVVNADSTVSIRNVKTGTTDGDKVDVTDGLKPGQVVVIDGADRLRDGSDVILPKGEHGNGTLAQNSSQPQGLTAQGGHGMFKLFRKLTTAEHDQICAMSKDDRRAWMKSHMAELMKRPDQPGAGGGRCSGGGRGGFGGGGGTPP